MLIWIWLLLILCTYAAPPDFEAAFEEFKAQFTEQWKQETLKYDGPNIRISLTISDQIFETSSSVLFDRKHGVTLFLQEFLTVDENSINFVSCNQDAQNDDDSEEGNLFKINEAFTKKMDHLHHQNGTRSVRH